MFMSKSKTALLALLLVAALGFTACGGGEKQTSTTDTTAVAPSTPAPDTTKAAEDTTKLDTAKPRTVVPGH